MTYLVLAETETRHETSTDAVVAAGAPLWDCYTPAFMLRQLKPGDIFTMNGNEIVVLSGHVVPGL